MSIILQELANHLVKFANDNGIFAIYRAGYIKSKNDWFGSIMISVEYGWYSARDKKTEDFDINDPNCIKVLEECILTYKNK